ncbi:MAG: hypothetical protein ACOCZU_06560 [Planctomycetota bacterium]
MSPDQSPGPSTQSSGVSASSHPDLEWISHVQGRWLIALPLLLGIAAVTALAVQSNDAISVPLEAAAPFILAAAVLAHAARSAVSRSLLSVVLACTSAVFILRELHDLPELRWMDKAIYVFLTAAALVIAWKHRRISRELRADPLKASLFGFTLVAYMVALLIDRRVFKFIPGEQSIHTVLEESAETIAHLSLLAVGLAGRWSKLPGDETSGDAEAA